MIEIAQVHVRDVAINRSYRPVPCKRGVAGCFQENGSDGVPGATMMKQDWVKAIGKKLREDLGDCPTLPQELVDALGRLEKAHQAGNLDGQTSVSKVGATPKLQPVAASVP